MPPTERRVHRHLPWLILTSFLAMVVVAMAVPLVTSAIRTPSFERVVATALALALLAVFTAFLLLNWRIRTVVDDTGVTQHWISRTYRLAYEEITGLAPDQAGGRWFLRIHCGERTFEVVPCHSFPVSPARPPRALAEAHADIAARCSTLSPGET